jgi:hypothetical protein
MLPLGRSGAAVSLLTLLTGVLATGCLSDPTLEDGHRFPSAEREVVAGNTPTDPDEKKAEEGPCLGKDCDDASPAGAPTTDAKPKDDKSACKAANACSGAVDLGTVSGDVGHDERSRQGIGSQWFSVKVTENDTNMTGASLNVTATLVAPSGANYDVFVYGDQCGGEQLATSAKPAGTTDQAAASWGESYYIPNFSADDRTVLIEVRHVSGPCDPNDKWTLLVRGGT